MPHRGVGGLFIVVSLVALGACSPQGGGGGAGSAASRTAPGSTGVATTPSATPAATKPAPRIDTIFIIVKENRLYADVSG